MLLHDYRTRQGHASGGREWFGGLCKVGQTNCGMKLVDQ
jgi:hypothetical protein